MNSKERRTSTLPLNLGSAFRDFVLEASESELDAALRQEDEDPEALLKQGARVIQSALVDHCTEVAAEELLPTLEQTEEEMAFHESFSKVVELLRRREGLSEQELARRARVKEEEIRRIEFDITYTPSPRTLYQLEEFFDLPKRSLVLLSGAVSTEEPDFKEGVLRFAANSKNMGELNRQEKRLLNEFVRFLAERAKRGGCG